MKRAILLVILTIPLLADSAHCESKWFVFLYGGQMTDGTLGDAFSASSSLENSYLMTVGAGREFYRYDDWISLELEGQFVQHFGIQDHEEFNLALVLRWLPFPWDSYLDTSFAAGDGLSYATEVPEIESERHDGEATRLLNYLMFELAFNLPQLPRWSLITRIHHRSGIFGLFDGVHGGSNAVCVGLKYHL